MTHSRHIDAVDLNDNKGRVTFYDKLVLRGKQMR